MKPDKLSESSPLLGWFTAKGWMPFPFQYEVWNAYLHAESGLIHAPTGTGKTYAAWLGPLIEWVAENPDVSTWGLRKRSLTPPLRVLWITPLRALAADTENALRAPLDALNIPWALETRTGDTSNTVRSRQRKKLPTALITTPESLSLLLTRPNALELFADLRMVVVDEWHELLSTKRGVQVELALARLRRWRPELRTWGLSATMGNLEMALQVLLGVANWETRVMPSGRLISANIAKALRIDTVIPPEIERFPWAGHLGLKLLPQVIEIIESNRSTLVFTNTRSQTEIWYQAILDARPDWVGEIALHHSSLDWRVRGWVENALHAGRLKCVVSTSSLDLGVDFAPVDRVMQIGSPKGVARLLQRAGRSGHQPGAESRVTCVPTHAFELIEVAAARSAVQQGYIEDRLPLESPLDTLLQHLVTVGLGGGFVADELLREVRTTYTYRNLPDEVWNWAIDFMRGGGTSLGAYPQYHRLIDQEGWLHVKNEEIARMHRLSIGTIVSDASLTVQYLKGGRVGQVEESFGSRLRPGDKFTLAGKVLEFVRLRGMKVWVRRAKNKKGVVPRWLGGRLPLSDELAHVLHDQLKAAAQGIYESPEMLAIRPILDLQEKWSAIPTRDYLLIERAKTREGHHLFFYPFEGRLAHEGLAALFAYRLSRLQPITFTFAANDYGFELLSQEAAPIEVAMREGLLSTVQSLGDILASLNMSEMARRQFREISRIAGLVFQRYPGGQMTSKQLQVSSGLLYDVLVKYDANNLLLEQSINEVLARQLEVERLRRALARFEEVGYVLCDVKRPTPFAFPLLVDTLRQTISSEQLEDRVRRMRLTLEKAANQR